MTDDASSDPSPTDPADPMGSEMISESELDDVLAQASSLAADLSEEIGKDANPPAASATIDGDSADTSVEVGLEELERLVASTREEVDGAEGDSGAPDPTDTPPEELAVPDFMSEFTEPASPAEEPSAPAPPPPAPAAAKEAPVISDPSLGIVATGTIKTEAPPEPLGVVGTALPETAADTDTSAAPEVDETADNAETEPTVGRRAALVQAITAKAGPILFTVCDRAVWVLEKVDSPLQRIGQVPRRLIGWLAIATLGTSLVALIVSAF